MAIRQVRTHLWYDNQAEAAARFYTSLFENSRITEVVKMENAGPAGDVTVVTFELEGHGFIAINAGPEFKFTEAISIYVECETQEDVDRLWYALTADGGEESMCGWLKDRFGLSWQIVPRVLEDLLRDPDPEKSQRVMQAMFQMQKLDVQKLEEAYQGEATRA